MNNTPIVKTEDKEIIQEGTFDNKAEYQIVALTKDDMQAMLIFQHLIVDALKVDEQAYFLEKSEKFLTSHFNKGSKAIGVVSNGVLLGQALIVHPTEEHPNTGMTDMVEPMPVDSISVIQGVGVHPLTRGMSIGDKLIKAWMDVAGNDNRANVIAETEQHNIYSWRLFVNNGLEIVSEATDPTDGAQLYNHHKVLTL